MAAVRPEDPRAPDDEPPLAEIVSALANQPVGTSWIERKRAGLLAFAERITTQGPFAEPVEIGWKVNRRLYNIGSGALAALIAYRVFVWLLPLTLVVVVGLGLYSDTTDTSVSGTVERFGLTGYFKASLAQTAAHGGNGRWFALFGGLAFLLYQTYALVRATSAVHSLVWGLKVSPVRRPLTATMGTLCLLGGSVLAAAALRTLPDHLGTVASIVALVAAYCVPFAAWLLASTRLPHLTRSWTGLVPGAVVVGAALGLLHAFNVFLLVPWLESREETYGVLGVAAGILLTLYLMGWAIAAGTALNRVLEERREAQA